MSSTPAVAFALPGWSNDQVRRVVLALLVLIALPGAAQAGTARVDVYTEPPGVEPESSCSRYMQCPPDALEFAAAPGEVNDVTISAAPGGFNVHDAGAPVTAGERCTSVDANTVFCSAQVVRSASLGDGDDRISAGGGASGGDGNDVLNVVSGDGGPGNDVVTCAGVICELSGGPGDDIVTCPGGTCDLSGGPGADRITGGDRADVIRGGPGGTGDDDLLDGGAGFDTLDYADHRTPVQIELAGAGQTVVSPGESDSIAGFEQAAGGSGDDVLSGPAGVTQPASLLTQGMNGGRGDDRIVVRSQATATGGPGNDTIIGAAGRQTLLGDRGNDSIRGGAGNDKLTGGDGADILSGQAGNDALGGRDGRGGNDRVACGTGSDRATADRGDRVSGCERVKLPRRR